MTADPALGMKKIAARVKELHPSAGAKDVRAAMGVIRSRAQQAKLEVKTIPACQFGHGACDRSMWIRR